MLRKLKVVVALALAAFAAVAYADPPARVGRLNYAAGPVSFAPGEAPEEWVQAVINRPLTSGDRLWADNNAQAELHVGSTALRLAPLTNVDVLNLDDQTLQLRLGQGAINLRVRELARDEIVEVATPTGAVLIRQPGSYRVSSDPQGTASRVVVHFGQAEVITPTQTVTVPSSQSAVIPANAGIAFEIVAGNSGDDFDRWSAERDRREDRATATRYVSRDMTGYEDLDQYGSWRTLPEYGAVWVPASVAPNWAPYRYGHWVWVSPWGWTWVDDAPWGFAPSHYGRWVWVDSYWAWAPGTIVRRPVYAPALVAFVGGSGFSIAVSSGPAVGWFPLGWREPYIPWYRASQTYVRNVNVTHVTNVTNIYNTTNITYANRGRPNAVTVVSQQAFVSARPVAQASLSVPQGALARAELLRERSPFEPTRASVAFERSGHRPPAQAIAREVVAITPPAPATARELPALRERGASFTRPAEAEPRVRLLRRDRVDVPERAPVQTTPQATRAAPTTTTAPAPQPRSLASPSVTAPAPDSRAPARPFVGTPPHRADESVNARAAERRESREARSVAPETAPRVPAAERDRVEARRAPTTVERERVEARREAPRAEPPRENAARRERAPEPAAPREGQIIRQSFPATRVPQGVPPREGPRPRTAPAPEAAPPRPQAVVAPRPEAPRGAGAQHVQQREASARPERSPHQPRDSARPAS